MGLDFLDGPIEGVVDVVGGVGERTGAVVGAAAGEAIVVVVDRVAEQRRVARDRAARSLPTVVDDAVDVAVGVEQEAVRGRANRDRRELLAARNERTRRRGRAVALTDDVAGTVEAVGGRRPRAGDLLDQTTASVVGPTRGARTGITAGVAVGALELEHVLGLVAVQVVATERAASGVRELVILDRSGGAVIARQPLQLPVVVVGTSALLLLHPAATDRLVDDPRLEKTGGGIGEAGQSSARDNAPRPRAPASAARL